MALRLDACDMSAPYIVAAVNAARRELDEVQSRLPQWLINQLPYMEEADLRRVEEMQQRESQAAAEKRKRLEPQLQARIDAAVAERERVGRREDKERADARRRADPYLLAEENARRRRELAEPTPHLYGQPAVKPYNNSAETLAAMRAQRPASEPRHISDLVGARAPAWTSAEEREAARLRLQRAEMERLWEWRVW